MSTLPTFGTVNIFRANVLDLVAQLTLAQTVAGESVDVAEHVAEAIVKTRPDDALRKIAFDVRNHVAHANPGRGDITGLGAVAQIDEDRRLPGNGYALGVIERFQLFELLLNPIGDLARNLLGGSARPLRLDHHGLDCEVGILLPSQAAGTRTGRPP